MVLIIGGPTSPPVSQTRTQRAKSEGRRPVLPASRDSRRAPSRGFAMRNKRRGSAWRRRNMQACPARGDRDAASLIITAAQRPPTPVPDPAPFPPPPAVPCHLRPNLRQRVDQRRSHHRGIGHPSGLAACWGVAPRTRPRSADRSLAQAGDRGLQMLYGRAGRPRDTGNADIVDEAGAAAEHMRQALVIRGWRDEANEIQPVGVA